MYSIIGGVPHPSPARLLLQVPVLSPRFLLSGPPACIGTVLHLMSPLKELVYFELGLRALFGKRLVQLFQFVDPAFQLPYT